VFYSRLYFLARPAFLSFVFIIPFVFIILFGIFSLETLGNSKGVREKNITFSALTLPPASGKKPGSIVVLLHGYGDTAENFLFLGAFLSQLLPDTLFVALNGPIPCKTIPDTRQWLSTPKNKRPQLLKEINNLTPPLNQYLDNLLKTHNIPPEKMALFGFSQGARIALHIGLRRPQCAGVIAFSGSYLHDPAAVNLAQPPILLIHGMEDQKAPVSLAHKSHEQFDALKMPVTLVLLRGVSHDIDPQGVGIAGEFLQDCFSGKIFDKR
jgi:phospholipase/carboxylesterase